MADLHHGQVAGGQLGTLSVRYLHGADGNSTDVVGADFIIRQQLGIHLGGISLYILHRLHIGHGGGQLVILAQRLLISADGLIRQLDLGVLVVGLFRTGQTLAVGLYIGLQRGEHTLVIQVRITEYLPPHLLVLGKVIGEHSVCIVPAVLTQQLHIIGIHGRGHLAGKRTVVVLGLIGLVAVVVQAL